MSNVTIALKPTAPNLLRADFLDISKINPWQHHGHSSASDRTVMFKDAYKNDKSAVTKLELKTNSHE